jgi:sorbose reductase
MSVLDLFRLDGKSAFVTGGSSGIGKRVALAYAEAGAQVAIVARDLERAQRVAEEIAAQTGGTVTAVRCDVTIPAEVEAMVSRVVEDFGGLDIAVCNAGIVSLMGLEEMTPERFTEIMNTNVLGVFLTASAAGRVMRESGGGSIITTASMSGHVVNTPQQEGHYCASKAAVIQLTKALAVELAPFGVRVNSVSPGYIMTELVAPMKDLHRIWSERIPLGRLGTPEELMALYVYLAGPGSSYMTGSDLLIDGGFTCI